MDELTLFVCTYNSGLTIERCLERVRGHGSKLIVIDHNSVDATAVIAEQSGATLRFEGVGLGYARQLAFDMVQTRFLAFVDSDVEVVEPKFFLKAVDILKEPSVGAVVGMSLGHRLPFGLPAGLLVLRAGDFRGGVIPSDIDARETYYLQRRLDELGLKTVYLADAMIHGSRFRKFKPEWEGANTRIACGIQANQLLFAFRVITMMSLNSRSLRNLLYVPIFYFKFLKGFLMPQNWRRLDRING